MGVAEMGVGDQNYRLSITRLVSPEDVMYNMVTMEKINKRKRN